MSSVKMRCANVKSDHLALGDLELSHFSPARQRNGLVWVQSESMEWTSLCCLFYCASGRGRGRQPGPWVAEKHEDQLVVEEEPWQLVLSAYLLPGLRSCLQTDRLEHLMAEIQFEQRTLSHTLDLARGHDPCDCGAKSDACRRHSPGHHLELLVRDGGVFPGLYRGNGVSHHHIRDHNLFLFSPFGLARDRDLETDHDLSHDVCPYRFVLCGASWILHPLLPPLVNASVSDVDGDSLYYDHDVSVKSGIYLFHGDCGIANPLKRFAFYHLVIHVSLGHLDTAHRDHRVHLYHRGLHIGKIDGAVCLSDVRDRAHPLRVVLVTGRDLPAFRDVRPTETALDDYLKGLP